MYFFFLGRDDDFTVLSQKHTIYVAKSTTPLFVENFRGEIDIRGEEFSTLPYGSRPHK